jgi:hypothetical protein
MKFTALLGLNLLKTERINLGTNSYVFSGIIVVSTVYYFDNNLLNKKAN